MSYSYLFGAIVTEEVSPGHWKAYVPGHPKAVAFDSYGYKAIGYLVEMHSPAVEGKIKQLLAEQEQQVQTNAGEQT